MPLTDLPPGSDGKPVNLLWTAGWDSTYRLLTLVLRHGRAVIPHYVVDPGRPGTVYELRAMRQIRERIESDYPGRGGLIQPTRVVLLDSIPPDPVVSARLARLRRRGHLGEQYDWLYRYVRAEQICELELCIHSDDKAEAFVREHVEYVADAGSGGFWRVMPGADDDLALFAGYRLPILRMTKREMRREATAQGFHELLELTWFCHTPINGRPCGICNPCRYTIEEGLADRLPPEALLRSRYGRSFDRLQRSVGTPLFKLLGSLARPIAARERRRLARQVR